LKDFIPLIIELLIRDIDLESEFGVAAGGFLTFLLCCSTLTITVLQHAKHSKKSLILDSSEWNSVIWASAVGSGITLVSISSLTPRFQMIQNKYDF